VSELPTDLVSCLDHLGYGDVGAARVDELECDGGWIVFYLWSLVE
jgi:hypothetical protein